MSDSGDVVFHSVRRTTARVTVAVTLYNYAEFIANALNSVLAQDLAELDLVVVDDCSTDGGAELAANWLESNQQRFGRATLLRHQQNQQLATARNRGFDAAQTEFVFVLDADNELYPRCLSTCLAAADATDAEAVYSIIEVFGDECGLMGTDLWDAATLRTGNYIDAMALVRRSAWQHAGGYRAMHGWEDYDLWLKFAEAGFALVRVPEILCRYRKHHRSMLQNVTHDAVKNGSLQKLIRLHHPSVLL